MFGGGSGALMRPRPGTGGGANDLNVGLCHTDDFILGGRVFIVDAKTTEAPDSAGVFFPPLRESAEGPGPDGPARSGGARGTGRPPSTAQTGARRSPPLLGLSGHAHRCGCRLLPLEDGCE